MKSIFITGAASGIGRAAAILFSEKGWFVGITDLNGTGLEELKRTLNGRIQYSALMDVTDEKRVRAVIEEFCQATRGKMDILFNNAGILRINPFESITLADQHAIQDINVKGVLTCTYHAFPYLRNTMASRVINMASAAALTPTPSQAAYSASKFWVKGFTESLNIEWKRHGIHVCDIMPNYVNTMMVAQNPGRLVDTVGVSITAEDIADTVWKAAGKDRLHWVVDCRLRKAYYKLRCIIPFPLERFVLKRMAGLQ